MSIDNNNLNNKKIILLTNITNNSFCYRDIDNTFTIFQSKDEILYLIYTTKKKSIISYNLNEFRIITEIKNAHEGNCITNLRHYFYQNYKADLIISISAKNNHIKIWNCNNWSCVLNIKDIYPKGIINSACFIDYDNSLYILSSNNNWVQPDFIKIFNFEGNNIGTIKNSKENVYYIDTYFEECNLNLYVITGNYNSVRSYDYTKNELYHEYCDDKTGFHSSLKIFKNRKITKLIESASKGFIRIWNFHSGMLINSIYICNLGLYGICIWDNINIFVGCGDNTIKLININEGKISKTITGFNYWVCTVCKIFHKKYGDCLVSQGIKDEQIKIWIIKS